MSRMLDLVRASALPAHQMMSAAKGALRVPAEEMVDILVYLAEHNKILGEQARLTLAAWDESSAKNIVASPDTAKEVLDYWISPKNLRPRLFPLLLENPSVSMQKLGELASTLKGEWIDAMLASQRVRASRQLLNDLSSNKELSGIQSARLQELLTGQPATVVSEMPKEPAPKHEPKAAAHPMIEVVPQHTEAGTPSKANVAPSEPQAAADPEIDPALTTFFAEHAAEIVADGDKPFQPIGGIHEEIEAPPAEPQAAAAAAASPVQQPAITGKPAHKKLVNPEDEKRGSVLQKIAKLDVKGRIQLAMKGTKEERSILVRDGTKVVALAVLDSPKITDGEVEKFAGQKNVLEALLRAIPMKRRFVKNYAVVRNLVANPRTPLDVSLGLMKNLLVQDLKNLSGNKDVADTVRKLALRMHRQKSETADKN